MRAQQMCSAVLRIPYSRTIIVEHRPASGHVASVFPATLRTLFFCNIASTMTMDVTIHITVIEAKAMRTSAVTVQCYSSYIPGVSQMHSFRSLQFLYSSRPSPARRTNSSHPPLSDSLPLKLADHYPRRTPDPSSHRACPTQSNSSILDSAIPESP